MNEIIKSIRKYIGLSQQEFAEKIGVTFASINRWENSKSTPNKIAQMKIYDVCKEMNVPIYDIIIKKISDAVNEINLPQDHIILYHSSKSGIIGPIKPISRSRCDFGKGFYMGTNPIQSLTLICDYEESHLYILSLPLNEMRILDISEDLDWAMFVAFNRGKMDSVKGTGLYDRYQKMSTNIDYIVGSIADDRMFYILDNFFQGNITDVALINSLSALNLGKQYVAISQHGCDMIKIETEIRLSYLERLILQDVSSNNRIKGISLANSICKNYRREGKFFDEILELSKEE